MASTRGVTLLLAVLCLAAAVHEAAAKVDGKAVLVRLVRELEAKGGFSTILSLLGESGLVPRLETYISTGQAATLFFPSNQAFQLLPPPTLRLLRTDKKKLQAILLYSGIYGFQTFAQLAGRNTGFQYVTFASQNIVRWPRARASTVSFGPPGAKHAYQIATIVRPNVAVSGHVIAHGTDHVLIPPILPKS